MPGTIIEYLKKFGDYSFQEMPMSDVDSLVLCQLSYLKFDGIVPDVRENRKSVTLEEVAGHADYEKLFADARFERDNRAMFEAMAAGKRYKGLKLNCYVNVIEKEWETQFSAVTFLLEDGTLYLAFRGTDETIIGWKEDFNMAFLSPVPGQSYSVKYLNMVTGKLRHSFYMGGHSKGGNLAVYAAMNCAPQVQERILKIYSMDGPGFRPEILESCRYERIQDKVVKILPHSSMVGMLFEKDIHYQVVESRTFGLAQHNPYTWLVDDGKFKTADDIYESRRKMDNTVNEWILSLSDKQLKLFVDTLYQVISASEAENLIEFTADWKKSMNGIITALKEVDDQTMRMLKEIIKSLFDIAGLRMKEGFMLRKKPPKKRNKKEEGVRKPWFSGGQDVPDAIEVQKQAQTDAGPPPHSDPEDTTGLPPGPCPVLLSPDDGHC